MNKNKKPIRMIRNDQFGGLKKAFSSIAGMLTMVAFVLGFGLSESKAQDPPSASFYNQVGDDVVNEITVDDGGTFTLIVGISSNVDVNAVRVSMDYDGSVLSIPEDGVADVAPEGFNIAPDPDLPLVDNENGMFIWEKGYIGFLPPFTPPPAGDYSFVELTFNVASEIPSQATIISYDFDDCFIGSAEGEPILSEAPDFVVNIEGLSLPGCTDPDACNFDENASEDDGSCVFPQWWLPDNVGDGPAILACEEPDGYFLADQDCAEEVTTDDPFCSNTEWDSICADAYGICTGDIVPGCTNPDACNFDENATDDDGSCVLEGDDCQTEDGAPGTIVDCECVGTPTPDNDNCEDATVAECGGTYEGSTDAATAVEGQEYCGTSAPSSSNGGVWFEITPGATLVSADLSGSLYDTKLFLYTGTCDALVCVDGDDDGGTGVDSFLEWEAEEGVTYYLYVTGFGTSRGDYLLNISCGFDCPDLGANIGDPCDDGDDSTNNDTVTEDCECVGTPAPDNDECEDATPIACGDVVEGSTVGATPADEEFCGTSNGTGGAVWYSFTADEQSNVVMSLCGSDFDTKLRIYQGPCDALECVAGDDDDQCDGSFALQSTVPFLAEAGVEYTVLVHGFSSNEGNYVLSVECEPTCTAEGGTIAYVDGSEETTICLGEGEEVDVVLEGQGGGDEISFAWVITDADLNILGLPEAPPFNFDDAGEGACLIWHLAFDPENSNVLEIAGSENPNAGDLEGCFDLSNPLTVIRENCEPSDCDNYEYYLADILEDGTTNIYEVALSGTDAMLTWVATSDIEVHIALNETDGLIYAVSKADGSYRTLDPDLGTFGPVEMLDSDVSEIIGATFNADGKLMISSQSENAIYSVMLGSNEVSVFDSYSPILGGDIDFGSDGTLYLATREGFGTFYIAIPDEIASDILVGTAPQLVTGVADTEDENLIFSHRDAMTLMVREYDGTPGTPYDIMLDGEPFMTFNGDLASGCADNRQPLDPCEEGNGECYAVSAVYVQGTAVNGDPLSPMRTDVNNSLGAPEGTDEIVFTTLGIGGSLTFEFDGVVPNGEGDDITVVETTFNNPGCDEYPEYADVSVSADGENFFYIGTVCKADPSVDISDAGEEFECVSFVRVASNDELSTIGDGFDVDGIIAIHNCMMEGDGGDGEEAAIVLNDDNSNTLTSYPNPTNGLSQAIFVTGITERATLEVYDMNGRLVQELFNGVAESGVEYRVDFDGLQLPNGVYMYRLTTDSETIVEKFMIAK